MTDVRRAAAELASASTEELIEVFDFDRICVIESRLGIAKSPSLRVKKKNIMSCVDAMSDSEFDDLCDFIDTLVRMEDLEGLRKVKK